MQTWIALIRGINVGGNNILPMAKLRLDIESRNLRNVRSYIQSGNLVFDSAAKTPSSLANRIGRKIEQNHGFRPQLVVFRREFLLRAIESNPFPSAVADAKSLHFFFLATPASDPGTDAIDKVKKSTARYRLSEGVFDLDAPAGIARSKLATNAEKYLGVVSTARNYLTVEKIASLAACN